VLLVLHGCYAKPGTNFSTGSFEVYYSASDPQLVSARLGNTVLCSSMSRSCCKSAPSRAFRAPARPACVVDAGPHSCIDAMLDKLGIARRVEEVHRTTASRAQSPCCLFDHPRSHAPNKCCHQYDSKYPSQFYKYMLFQNGGCHMAVVSEQKFHPHNHILHPAFGLNPVIALHLHSYSLCSIENLAPMYSKDEVLKAKRNRSKRRC
jgi:hypothetical protein